MAIDFLVFCVGLFMTTSGFTCLFLADYSYRGNWIAGMGIMWAGITLMLVSSKIPVY